ncbi:GntR family transcriptional regulator [Xylanibacter rodentium]|mgnify:FL=1|jgi:DNA-binding transcriptional regulator YhcF (GntR family)|uniref:GntR family transcriptional regulator n=1 Tax=Xylanibacter rodentium TaxID=2736289 RepID=A0ABX2AUS3_9BACT|nr:GntR family transcriptional regulator [Xylanibacter rodentium]NPE12186.1 GntR family transcriptional regulator [Prevotella sp. PJ1A]NPE14474.1 GntR family transcriptional regulator [Xylanibacter rodentium]NPE39682.1 GntR family transcriptional regulator [Prevotella sp. PCJ2]
MTTFSNDKAIYLQMADRLCDEILAGLYGDDDRIPSVREYAVLLQVNTNTAVKAYDALARDGIIYNRRGLGYFVSAGARDTIMQARRREFMEQTLPDVFRRMRLLGIGIDEVVKRWE